MSQYLFQLGRQPEISLAELQAVLPDFEWQPTKHKQFVIGSLPLQRACPALDAGGDVSNEVETEGFSEAPKNSNPLQFPLAKGDEQSFFDQLGGSIRMAKIIKSCTKNEIEGKISDILVEAKPEGKITFGIASFCERPLDNKTILMGVKKDLKLKERNCRFVNRNWQHLDAGTLFKERIVPPCQGGLGGLKACEILVIPHNSEYIIAQTIAAQNVEQFAARDVGKTARDMQVGMLPAKLALMMMNLSRSQGKLNEGIWDPFCGTGTVLIEAAALGIKQLGGSDLNPAMVHATKQNSEQKNLGIKTWLQDATKLDARSQKLDARCVVVTEGYLGPICHQPVNTKQLQEIRNELSPLYGNFCRNIFEHTDIKTMVLCVPNWQTTEGTTAYLEKNLAFLGSFWENSAAAALEWRRPQQTVGRQILVLHRK